MDEFYGAGVEADAAVRIGTGCSVFKVALNAASYVRELAADLVMAACQKFNFHQVVSLRTLKVAVVQAGELGTAGAFLGHERLI